MALPTWVRDLVAAAAQRYGVDPYFALAVATVEDPSGDPNAVSEAGAIGLMQLMPGTAADLGVNPWDPAENVDGGVRFLGAMLKTFGGDADLAAAAYNAGPVAVKAQGGIPHNGETEIYVPRVKAAYAELRGQPLPEQADSGAPDLAPGSSPPSAAPSGAPFNWLLPIAGVAALALVRR